jgi:hypothetical protein
MSLSLDLYFRSAHEQLSNASLTDPEVDAA